MVSIIASNNLNEIIKDFKKNYLFYVNDNNYVGLEDNKEFKNMVESVANLKKEIEYLTESIEENEHKFNLIECEEFKAKEEAKYFQTELDAYERLEKENEALMACIENYENLEKRVNEAKKENLEIENKIKSSNLEIDKLMKINNLESSSPFVKLSLDASLPEMRLYYKYKLFEKLLGVRIFKEVNNDDDQFKVQFNLLKDDCVDSLTNSINAKSIKRRKLIKSSESSLIVNSTDAKFLFENYIELLAESLTKAEIEEAMKCCAIDWMGDTNTLKIMLNSSSKIAQIKLPKYYPFAGTSMIKLISLSGYETSKIKDFKIEENYDSLLHWVMGFIDHYNTNLIV